MRHYKLTILFFSTLVMFILNSCGQSKSQTQKEITKLTKIEIEINSLLTVPDKTDEFTLVFNAKTDTSKKLTMNIGRFEVQLLSVEIEKMKPAAPLPLDLFQDFLIKTNYNVNEVFIDSLINGIYTAKIFCSNGQSKYEIKARPADAVTIALKFNSPIYVDKKLVN